MGRIWRSVELNRGTEEKIFREFLVKENIVYESCGAYNLVHFSCLMDDDEAQAAAEVLSEL